MLLLSFQPHQNPVLIKWDSKTTSTHYIKEEQSHIRSKGSIISSHVVLVAWGALVLKAKGVSYSLGFSQGKGDNSRPLTKPHLAFTTSRDMTSMFKTPVGWNELWEPQI